MSFKQNKFILDNLYFNHFSIVKEKELNYIPFRYASIIYDLFVSDTYVSEPLLSPFSPIFDFYDNIWSHLNM